MAYALHTLRPAHGSRRAKKRIGRGNASGHGTYSTRGAKGQRARSGGRKGLKRKGMKRIIASLPKYHGFTSLKPHVETVRLGLVAGRFADGATVTLQALKRQELVPSAARKAKLVVGGEVKKKLTFRGIAASAGARAAVEKAGGAVT